MRRTDSEAYFEISSTVEKHFTAGGQRAIKVLRLLHDLV